MEASRSRNKTDVLHDFQVSFFAMSRLSSFPWTFLETEVEKEESSELISDILKQTCLHPLCHKHPPSLKYRRLFLTELIRRHEASDADPSDELYDALGNVLGAEEGTECYKSYLLPGGEVVSLSEKVALISEGTTGLVTWEAALFLAEWSLENQQFFTGRTVLELGSGVGFTGIAVCRSCCPARYVFTDCHPRVLQKLRVNVQLNGLEDLENLENLENLASPRVRVQELDWQTASAEQLAEIKARTVIAADVVYDPDIVVCLVKLLSRILRCASPAGPPEVLICSTIRNPDTYNSFKHQLEASGIRHRVITGPVRHVFPYKRVSTIEMIQLYT